MKRQIRLPFNTSGPLNARKEDNFPCGICKRDFSKYTCPSCNVPYCSLFCFRSEGHSQCTEPFFKRQVEEQIRESPSANPEDKKRMLEILKRFEEERSDSEDEVEDDLRAKLESIDLDNADPDEVLALLSGEQREAFLKLVADPESEAAKNILVLDERVEPWWESPLDNSSLRKKYGHSPEMMDLPESLRRGPPSSSRPILFNLFAISLVYAHTTRMIGSSPLASSNASDASSARELIKVGVPFLTDSRSTTLFTSVDSAITDVSSRLTNAAPILHLLLKDSRALLHHSPVTEAEESPRQTALLMISDLSAVLARKKNTPIPHKLGFYASHVLATEQSSWDLLLSAIQRRMAQRTNEQQDVEVDVDAERKTHSKIEEM